MKTVVIIGNSFAGHAAAQIFLATKTPLQLVIIAPSESTYNNIASPRLLVQPELADQAIIDVRTNLEAKRSIHQLEYIVGTVQRVKPAYNTLSVGTASSASTITVSYDLLIVATGHRNSTAVLTSFSEGSDATLNAVNKLSRKIISSQTICVIGGGSTGVEVSAEIAQDYPEKQVTLITGSDRPLKELPSHISSRATTKLRTLGVEIINDCKASVVDSEVTVMGETHKYDLVIPTWQYTPNSDFLPDEFKDERGYIITDGHFAVKGLENVFALGDVSSITRKLASDIVHCQSSTLKAAITRKLSGQGNLKPYSQGRPFMTVPIGRRGGVGIAFGWSLPNFFVYWLMSKDYMIPAIAKHFA
ncbi:hypothetical protein DICA3_C21638 [Diutina catenulata]